MDSLDQVRIGKNVISKMEENEREHDQLQRVEPEVVRSRYDEAPSIASLGGPTPHVLPVDILQLTYFINGRVE